MNVFFKMLLCTMLLATFVACNDDDDVKDAILEVNYKNLNGTWRLSEWNGKEMNDELYCYITFDRKEHTYIMYQNLNSMYSRKLTGSFLIEEKEDGFILSGTYDFGKGDWANKYIVTEISSGLSLTIHFIELSNISVTIYLLAQSPLPRLP